MGKLRPATSLVSDAKATRPPAASSRWIARLAAFITLATAKAGPLPVTVPAGGRISSVNSSSSTSNGVVTATVSTPIWRGSVQPAMS